MKSNRNAILSSKLLKTDPLFTLNFIPTTLSQNVNVLNKSIVDLNVFQTILLHNH